MSNISKIKLEDITYDIKDLYARNGSLNIRKFNTVALMKAATDLTENTIIITAGFSSANDGGSATYILRAYGSGETANEVTTFACQNSMVAEILAQNEITTLQVGIIGDGSTDETTKLQSFFNYSSNKHVINSNNILIDNNIIIPSNRNIVFAKGCKISRKTNGLDTYFMFNIVNKHDITITNAHLVGDKDTHTGNTGEWGYGINIAASRKIIIENALIEKTWGDGIYVGYSYSETNQYTTSYVTINKCIIKDCSRNGISVCGGENIIVSNCVISGTDRVAPKSGIDIEPEGPDGYNFYLKNVQIENTTTENNGESGICLGIATATANNVTISGHKSYGEKHGVVCYSMGANNSVEYRNGYIVKCNDAGLLITKTQGSKFVIKNVVVDSTTKYDSAHGYNAALVITTSSANDGDLIVDNIEHIKSYSSLYEFADLICVRGSSGNVFSNLELKNIYTTKYLSIPYTANVNLGNSVFEHSYTSSNDFNSFHNTNKIVASSQYAADSLWDLYPSLADGEYTVIVSGNEAGNIVYVRPKNFTKVYDYSAGDISTNGIMLTSACTAYMKFKKVGNKLYYLERSGFHQ